MIFKSKISKLMMASLSLGALMTTSVVPAFADDSSSDQTTTTTTTSNNSMSVSDALSAMEAQQGNTLYNGQCYGLSAWYAEQLGGPTMMGSGHEYAQDIGSDYDWASYGFTVTNYPSISDIKPGDIICWEAGGALSPGVYGHTGVVVSIDSDGNMVTLEQNAENGQVVSQYNRTFNQTTIKSVIHKN